jgi:hypothetical protein
MWRIVREGLRFYGRVLVTAWTGTTIGLVAVFAILAVLGVIGGRAALLWVAVSWPVSILIASAVAGWIAIGTELTEHRVRMHLVLPVSIGHVALAQFLLPAALLLLGLAVAHAATTAVQAIYSAPTPWLGHVKLDLIAAHLLFLLQLTFAVREVTLLRETGWWKSALGSLALLILCAPVWMWVGWPIGNLTLRTAAITALGILLMAFTVSLFRRRTQFTK